MHDFGNGLWTLDVPDFQAGVVKIGLRASLMRLRDDTLVLWSPVAMSDDDVNAVRAIGRVAHIVAPNALHHLFLNAAVAAFPDAKVWLAPALSRKLKDAPPHALLSELTSSPLPGLVVRAVDGAPRVDESVALHAASRTLVVCDLAFHITRRDHWPTRMFMALNGGMGTFKPSRIMKLMVNDKRALRVTVDALCALDFERIVVSHGDVVEHDGPRVLRDAFAWLAA
jgi:hypothetical protein